MPKVTSKLQVTVPKRIAEAYSIRPGDEIDWEAAGDVIRVIPHGRAMEKVDRASRLRLFDKATERLQNRGTTLRPEVTTESGWTREDLYFRGRAD